MDRHKRLEVILGVVSSSLVIFLLFVVYFCRKRSRKEEFPESRRFEYPEQLEKEDLISFSGGEDLTIHDILDAPGEVVGQSSYGTLYKASIVRTGSGSAVLLRFLRPACAGRMEEILSAIQLLGLVRHPNLVPLEAFYSGARGEKLLVHPFFNRGTLSQFLKDGNDKTYRWPIIYRISLGIAKGLDHLHTGLQKPIIHGNLKSKNILLDSNYQPYISDFGLHLLLKATTAQEMLETSADQGYKAPELIKLKEASTESDIYSLGIIFSEIICGKEPIYGNQLSDGNVYLPVSMRNAVLDHKVSEMLNPKLLSRSNSQKSENSFTEECLLTFFQLAMSCCSPSPSLRPNIKQIVRKLEEIGQ